MIYFSLRIVPLIRKLFIRILLTQSNSIFSKFSFCSILTFFLFVLTSPDWKLVLIFSFFPDSSHVDTVFLGTPYFSALPSMVSFLIPAQWLLYIFQKEITSSPLNSPFFTIYKCNSNAIWNDKACEWKYLNLNLELLHASEIQQISVIQSFQIDFEA